MYSSSNFQLSHPQQPRLPSSALDPPHCPPQQMWRTFVKKAGFSPLSTRAISLLRCAGASGAKPYPYSPVSARLGLPPRNQNGTTVSSPVRASEGFVARGLATVAEAVSSSTDVDDEAAVGGGGEVQELLEQLMKEDVVESETETDNDRKVKKGAKRYYRPRKYPNMPAGMSAARYVALKRRQVKMETEAWERAVKEYQELLGDMCQQKLVPNLPYMKSLFMGWFEPLRDRIAEEQKLCREEGKNKISYAPYFVQLPEDMMAVITMHKLMGLLMTTGGGTGVRTVMAAMHIGDAIEQEARIRRFLGKTKKKGKKQEEEEESTDEKEKLKKKVKQLIKRQSLHTVRMIVKEHDNNRPWGQINIAKVGSRLIDLLIQTAYIQPPVSQSGDGTIDIRPAFRHVRKVMNNDISSKGRKCYGMIECDELVHKGLDKSARHMVMPYNPMLVPPVDWTGYDKGAYFFLPSQIMRTHGVKQQREAVRKSSREQMKSIYEALNTLGNTRWRINKRVLNVVDRLWSSGGCVAGLVDREDIPLPEKPDTDDDTELREWKWELKKCKKVNSERHSQRCDVELKLTVARKMKDEDGFYYPHNVDFRGRAYPMHPYLNHLGSDLCRGVLEFAEGRPLGKRGLRWLKIHLANLYAGGVDKLSLDGRIAFTENNVENIFDSADKPLEGQRWWLNAEDPFQCLAVCINLAEAFRSSSPESIISHIPVHQDGSCNGLQHYAALGRDQLGAAAVNLVDGDKPADVYTGIANRVLRIMHDDSEKDPALFPDALYAKVLLSQVDRKLVKQTVMTSVYGVTYIGARDQIRKRLKERTAADIDDDVIFGASGYAAKVTLTALGEMFQAARDIMNWLGDCAKIIASENHPVCWTTPIGLPVVQPYKAMGTHLVRTSLQTLTLRKETDKVLVKRQRTAFPPNFVHSLDGSHMMMTSIACRKMGMDFAGVHDSYWTHACDVDVMNKILREKFVELYQTPILENLLAGFQKSFPSLHFPSLPERGDFDLREVIHSTYFFN